MRDGTYIHPGELPAPAVLPDGFRYRTHFEATIAGVDDWGLQPLGWIYLGTQHGMRPDPTGRHRFETHIWARVNSGTQKVIPIAPITYPSYDAPYVAIALTGRKIHGDRDIQNVTPEDLTWRLTLYTDTLDLFDPLSGTLLTQMTDSSAADLHAPVLEGCPIYSKDYTGQEELLTALAVAQALSNEPERLAIVTSLLTRQPLTA